MIFRNDTDKDIHIRMTSNLAGDSFIKVSPGGSIDLPEEFGSKSGLTKEEQ